MRTITLNHETLTIHSKKLAQNILKESWQPHLVIGIKSGGVYVAEPLFEELKKNYPCIYNTVCLSRASTKKKRDFQIDIILKKLPYFLLNLLRNIEVFLFEFTKSKQYKEPLKNEVKMDKLLLEQINNSNNILLVDDAIDSGRTILIVKNMLLSINKNADIKVAVLTTTHKKPYINADFSLYSRILLRSPWSMDYKEKK